MPQFQGSLGPIQELQPKRDSEGLKPHLDAWLKSNERAKARRVRSADPDRFWWFWCLVVIGLVLSAAQFL